MTGRWTDQQRERLVALRGNRSQRDLAEIIGVTAQAVSQWEITGRIGRQNAAAYDEALGAGGEVLAVFGYTTTGPTLTDIDQKLDEVLNRLGAVPTRAELESRAELLTLAVRDLGASVARLHGVEPPAPRPRSRPTPRKR